MTVNPNGPSAYENVGRTYTDAAGTISELAGQIKDDSSGGGAQVRIAMVVAIQNDVGRKVQTDQTGTAWVARLEDSAINLGDRVALLQQGSLWLCLGRLNGEPGAVPIGGILPFAGGTPTAGWLACNGQAISRTGYPALYAMIGVGYGAGDGSTTFNLPNLEGRFPLGAQGLTYFQTTTGGAASVTLTEAQIPSHHHGEAGGHSHLGTPGYKGDFGATPGSNIVLSTTGGGAEPITSVAGVHQHAPVGSGGAHTNMPPYLAIAYIIRAL